MADELLKVSDLRVEYTSGKIVNKAVNGISFTVCEGENLGFVGETGAGKTTTALSILGLLPKKVGKVTSGSIFFQGKDLLQASESEMRLIRGGLISMIFQDPMTSLNPVHRVGFQIAEVLKFHSENKNKTEIEDKVDSMLNLVGIPPNRKKDYPHQFSGGMKQRVIIAIALACNPALLIADEPTTALDVTIQAQVLEMMDDLKMKLNTSMILITHDLGIVAQTCDKLAIMYSGEIVEYGSVYDIFDGKSHHPYTSGLFGAVPDMTSAKRRLDSIPGLMTDPSKLPSGCKFHSRCATCQDRCKEIEPPLFEISDGHYVKCLNYE